MEKFLIKIKWYENIEYDAKLYEIKIKISWIEYINMGCKHKLNGEYDQFLPRIILIYWSCMPL